MLRGCPDTFARALHLQRPVVERSFISPNISHIRTVTVTGELILQARFHQTITDYPRSIRKLCHPMPSKHPHSLSSRAAALPSQPVLPTGRREGQARIPIKAPLIDSIIPSSSDPADSPPHNPQKYPSSPSSMTPHEPRAIFQILPSAKLAKWQPPHNLFLRKVWRRITGC